MERAAWTDERLDDLAESVRTGFARVDQDLRDLRTEMHEGFTGIRGEMTALDGGLRGEIQSVKDGLRGEIQSLRISLQAETNELRRVMMGIGGGMIVGLIGVIAAILARGA